MKIIIMHQTITKHDAVGNDIECMFNILSERCDVRCYAENKMNPKVLYATENELKETISATDNIIIYHHSLFWEYGESILDKCDARVIIRYHNITPAKFFKSFNESYVQQCELGRVQTSRMVEKLKNAYWLCDSQFNCNELDQIDENRIFICPPFHKIEDWTSLCPDENIMKSLLFNCDINLLFVGRIAPNKGHMFLIDVVKLYVHNFDNNIKLRFIGKFDDSISEYNNQIKKKIQEFDLEENIEFIGEINDPILISYYLGSDFFICASEHEGFCVPLIESQYFKLPVIAMQSSAVTETIGDNQILLRDDPKSFAAAISLLFNNEDYYSFISQKGNDNYHQRFSFDVIKGKFRSFMECKLGVNI